MPYAYLSKPAVKRVITQEQMRWQALNRDRVLGPLAQTVLQKARDLLSDQRRWCKGTLSKNDNGGHVAPYSPMATRWCALGAIEKASHEVALEMEIPAGFAIEDLNWVAIDVAQTHIRAAAKGHENGDYNSIPTINDNDRYGGYQAIITGLMMATGIDRDVAEAAVAFQAQATEDKREAALKGWRKRRDARRNALAQAEAAQTPIEIGGTVPTPAPAPTGISITFGAVSEVTA